jgi:hypothetical protein
VVVLLDQQEFKSTWVGNKAVYRTRMAIADGGELIVLAPGVERFGEDESIDRLIEKYGYCGSERVLSLIQTQRDLRENLSAAAHLMQGSTDNRFSVTYCTNKLSGDLVRKVGYRHAHCDEAMRKYNPQTMREGFTLLPDGEEVYYISNPAIGLWAERRKFL